MPTPEALLTFVVAGIILNLIPGPDILYIVGRSLAQGRVAGIVSCLGIAAGCLVHVAAATLGLRMTHESYYDSRVVEASAAALRARFLAADPARSSVLERAAGQLALAEAEVDAVPVDAERRLLP